jgi:23S rRNA (guanosine2251-2'-O)-methyltransferase
VRNFGAIARSAECAGVNAIIIPSRGAAQVNGDAIKTSAGALHKIPVCREDNLKSVIDYLKESGLQVVACTEKTDSNYYSIDLTTPTLIIMGSEEDGISGEYLKRTDHKAKIPLMGEIGSLNVSVATGIILYEAVRQRLVGS